MARLIGLFIGKKSKKTMLSIIGVVIAALLARYGIISQDIFEVCMILFGLIGIPAGLWAKLDKVAKKLAEIDDKSSGKKS